MKRRVIILKTNVISVKDVGSGIVVSIIIAKLIKNTGRKTLENERIAMKAIKRNPEKEIDKGLRIIAEDNLCPKIIALKSRIDLLKI